MPNFGTQKGVQVKRIKMKHDAQDACRRARARACARTSAHAHWNLREFDEVSETVEFFEKLSELLDATEKIKRFRNGRRPRRFSPRKMMCGKAAAEIFVR